MRFSIKAAPDGTRYVDVDVDQGRFEGMSIPEMRVEAKKVIMARFGGKVIGEGDKRAFVNRRSADEYTY